MKSRWYCYGSLENLPRPRIIFFFEYDKQHGGDLNIGWEISDRFSDPVFHVSYQWVGLSYERARRIHLFFSKLGWPWRR